LRQFEWKSKAGSAIFGGLAGDCDMATTARATANGIFDDGGGHHQSATAALSAEGLAIAAADGTQIALWAPEDLTRTSEALSFRVGSRLHAGTFSFDIDAGGELIRALAIIPDADAPPNSRALASTMVTVVGLTLAAMFVLAQAFFWLAERLFAPNVPGN
jgi:hypothetical protein